MKPSAFTLASGRDVRHAACGGPVASKGDRPWCTVCDVPLTDGEWINPKVKAKPEGGPTWPLANLRDGRV